MAWEKGKGDGEEKLLSCGFWISKFRLPMPVADAAAFDGRHSKVGERGLTTPVSESRGRHLTCSVYWHFG